jgi:hypothetical protein
MAKLRSKLFALLGGALFAASSVLAQDSGPLIDLLVKKGMINSQEAEDLRAELLKDSSAGIVSTISGGKSTVGLSLTGRLQIQYAGLGATIDGNPVNPVSTEHFFLRRIYLGVKTNLGNGWSGNLNYDFAGSTFDMAFIQWRQSDALAVDIGFRKVPFGLEEWYTSSGSLKAIERSPATRFFVESNNGRRLGAGSYRTGVFVGGKLDSGLFYNVAATNPERDESAAGVTSSGTNANNNLSYWGNLGYAGKAGEDFLYTFSGSVGYLPDQGGTKLGAGDNLTVYNAFADFAKGDFDLQLEYFGSDNQHGVSAVKNSKSSAYSIQPAYKFSEKIEGVVRYTKVDSDGRGIQTSDGIRSAPSGGTMDKLDEWYAGFSYFFRGNDVKWQLGYIYGTTKDTVTGGTAGAKTQGVRSQMQVNF